MDCPNCGAYNTATNLRCRRCNHILPTDGETTDETADENTDWGPASDPGQQRWEDHFRSPSSSPDRDDEAETVSTEPDPWTRPAEEPTQPSDWDIAQSSSGSGSGSSWGSRSSESSTGSSKTTGGTYTGGNPPNYLWPSIGATLCCCAPLGIPAIIYASRVDTYVASGDISAAEEASNKAKMWSLAAAGVSAMFWIAIICTGAFGAEGTVV